MSISEQVKELRMYADEYEQPPYGRAVEKTENVLRNAADTIEALSTKLQAANVEQPSHIMKNDTFTKIITALDERIGAEWRIIAGLNDETQIYGCTRSLEAYQQSKLIVEQNIEEYKEKQSETDYGGGWIPCKRKMPEVGKPVLVCDKQGNVCIRAVTCKIRGKKHWSQCKNDVIAWRELPEPYHPQP